MPITTTNKSKIKDLFNPITNPAGGFNMANRPSVSKLLTQAPVDRSKLTVGPGTGLSEAFSGTPDSKPNQLLAGWSMREDGSFVAPRGPSPAPAPVNAPAPGGQGGYSPAQTSAPASAPASAAPTTEVAMGEETVTTPQQFMNPDGSMKTPEQIATEVAETLKTSSATGDVGRMAGAEFGGAGKTEEQLRAEAALVNNSRNDIASGETDPFGVAGESGVAYTPAELQAIESAYAGVYDPAIVTAQAKLEAKQTENAFSREVTAEANQAERDFQNDLTMLGKKHDYDLEKMSADQEFQKSLASYKASLSGSGAGAAGGLTPYSDERSIRTIQSIDELMGQVNNKTVGWGSLLAGVPSTDATSFRSQLNTLKAAIAFGELTAMREASKTGGALGNVSNIELGLLESALAGLDAAQSPEDFRGQLSKAKESINRWRAAQGAAALGAAPVESGGGAIAAGTRGDAYGYPGYVSDGTQWVAEE